MEKKEKKDKKYRCFVVMCYGKNNTDDECTFEHILELIKAEHFDYVYCYHDKDRFEEDAEPDENGNGGHKKGEYKKAHYHIVFRWVNGSPRYVRPIASWLGVNEHNINGCTLDEQLCYLMHFRYPEKTQYPFQCVMGSQCLLDKLQYIVNSDDGITISEQLKYLIDVIDTSDYIFVSDFFGLVVDLGYLSAWRQFQSTFINAIREHNLKINMFSDLNDSINKLKGVVSLLKADNCKLRNELDSVTRDFYKIKSDYETLQEPYLKLSNPFQLSFDLPID